MALYVFAYSIYYFFSTLSITETASVVLYFGYTFMMVLILFVFTGESKVFCSALSYSATTRTAPPSIKLTNQNEN